VHVMAALAEHEREMISARTKAALAQARARGKTLGGDRGNIRAIAAQGRIESARVRKDRALRRADDLRPIISQIETAGTATLTGIAAALNAMRVSAPRGGEWSAGQVARVKRSWA
jgi:DNA invertase Pin-like site-specific DNA recombinase